MLETDKRSYRSFRLKNGIKAIVIHEPGMDKSAAALAVNVGRLHEPKEIPGLAHFCEVSLVDWLLIMI